MPDPTATSSHTTFARTDDPVQPKAAKKADPPKADKKPSRIQELITLTGLSRDELIDRLLLGAYSEGSTPSRDELLSGPEPSSPAA